MVHAICIFVLIVTKAQALSLAGPDMSGSCNFSSWAWGPRGMGSQKKEDKREETYRSPYVQYIYTCIYMYIFYAPSSILRQIELLIHSMTILTDTVVQSYLLKLHEEGKLEPLLLEALNHRVEISVVRVLLST